MSEPLTGGCQCGAVRYTLTGARVAYCCHCTECRKQSASAFGISVPVFEGGFQAEGSLMKWTRPTDSGSYTDCFFCPDCGSRIYHSGHNRPGLITVKGGSLDDPQAVPIVAHIWTSSRLEGLPLDPKLPQWDTQPKSDREWMELMQDGET